MGSSKTRLKATLSTAAVLTALLTSACTSTTATGCKDQACTHCDAAVTADSTAPAAPVISAAPIGQPMSTVAALADFDAAWQLINDTHFDIEFNGVDWDAMREQYRPQAEASTTREKTRSVIRSMLDNLGQSHFGVIPKEAPKGASDEAPDETITQIDQVVSETISKTDAVVSSTPSGDPATDGEGNADLGLEVLIIDRRAVVSSIRPDGPADLAGIRTGWIISNIRSDDVSKGLNRLADAVGDDLIGIYGVARVTNVLQGPEGSEIDLVFLDSTDNPRPYTLARETMPGEAITFGNLPPMQTNLDWGWYDSDRYNLGDKKIGYIKFSVWMIPIMPMVEEAMVGLKDADGIVIDLRGNPGGVGGLAPGMARYFLSEKQSLGVMQMRGQKMTFNVSPIVVTRSGERLRPFTGPVAILTNQGSASTSEFFAGGMQALERVEVFGTRSAGMALAAAMDKLPSGDVLLHAISDYTTSAGNAIEATGVIPEHPIPATREDLLNGIDAPTHAAVDWIKYHD